MDLIKLIDRDIKEIAEFGYCNFSETFKTLTLAKEEIKMLRSEFIRPLSLDEVLDYEIRSHWLASWIGFEWGQYLIGKYFAWKLRRKYNRYLVSLKERNRVLNGL